MDQLASKGIRFTNAYCANPFCMPNRSTIFTGKYPSIHGVRSNGINLNPKIPTFIESIRDSGYNTSAIGKIHLNWYGNPYSRKHKSTEMLIPFLYKEEDEKIEISNYYGFEEVHLTNRTWRCCWRPLSRLVKKADYQAIP